MKKKYIIKKARKLLVEQINSHQTSEERYEQYRNYVKYERFIGGYSKR